LGVTGLYFIVFRRSIIVLVDGGIYKGRMGRPKKCIKWLLTMRFCANLARLSQKSASQFKKLLFVVDTLNFECRMQPQI
jgi:hypothetical protein